MSVSHSSGIHLICAKTHYILRALVYLSFFSIASKINEFINRINELCKKPLYFLLSCLSFINWYCVFELNPPPLIIITIISAIYSLLYFHPIFFLLTHRVFFSRERKLKLIINKIKKENRESLWPVNPLGYNYVTRYLSVAWTHY